MEYKIVKWDKNSTITLESYKHVSPVYYVNLTLTKNKLTAKFVPESNSYGAWFNYHVGIKLWTGNKNSEPTNPNVSGYWSWGASSSYTYSSSDELTLELDISSLSLPIFIRPVCVGCDHSAHTVYHDFVDYGSKIASKYTYQIEAAHTHISKPSTPTIIKTTGTTIKVQVPNSNCQVGEVINNYVSLWKTPNSSKQYTFSGYSNGSTHYFRVRQKCSCGTYYYSNIIMAKTWSMTSNTTSNQSTFYKLKFKASHTKGTIGTDNTGSEKIHYNLYEVTYNSNNVETSRKAKYVNDDNYTVNSGEEVTFTGLSQNKNYVCVVYSTGGLQNISGNADNKIEIKRKTATVFSVKNTSASKTDLNVLMINTSVTPNNAKNIKCDISVFPTSGATTTAVFTKTGIDLMNVYYSASTEATGLTYGTRYRIVCKYYGTSTDTTETYTITKTLYTSTLNGEIEISNITSSGRAVKFDVKTNIDVILNSNYKVYKCIKILNSDTDEEEDYDNILSSMGYTGKTWSKYTETIPNSSFTWHNSEESKYIAEGLSYGIADSNNIGPGLLHNRRYIIYIKCCDANGATIGETTHIFSTTIININADILETTQNSITLRVDPRRYDGNYINADAISTNSKYTFISNPSIVPVANNLYQNNSLKSYIYDSSNNPSGILINNGSELEPDYEYKNTPELTTSSIVVPTFDQSIRLIYKFDNLIYYCDHKAFIGFTDGFNVISTYLYAQTEFPYVRIYIDDYHGQITTTGTDDDEIVNTDIDLPAGWYKAMPYIFYNDEWVLAAPLIFSDVNGTKKWLEANGDN